MAKLAPDDLELQKQAARAKLELDEINSSGEVVPFKSL
jgi:hypothetical protein